MKFRKISLFLYLFFAASYLLTSTQSFSGGDPDEFAQEEERAVLSEVKSDKSEDIDKNKLNAESIKNISEITGICLSFPEAIAYKEHFACSADQEKNRMARINWSFSKLLLR